MTPAAPGREAEEAAGLMSAWKRPSKRRVRTIRDRLREMYGRQVNDPHGHPIAELVRTILSQNTNDTNRDAAYDRLRERFPTWVDVRDAPLEDVQEAIRTAGLANTKGPSIQEALRRTTEEEHGEPDLDWILDVPREESIGFLTSLSGVGRKTAACVLIFTYDLPEIPIDTHVYRVGGRLGLFPERISFEKAHDLIREIVDPEDSYEFHINLINHGRSVCRPRPRCDQCGLRRMCPWFRSHRGELTS